MHFFYLDETGCNGRDLEHTEEQPIFVSGGIAVRDEGWNKTYVEFNKIIKIYFNNNIPKNFELHTADLFSTEGSGHFIGHSRERRNNLIHELLDLIIDRKHHLYYFGIDKEILRYYDTTRIIGKLYLDLKAPYLVAYDYIISVLEKYIKNVLGNSARGLIIIDQKDIFSQEVELITHYRRFEGPVTKRIKWITEFSYPIDSLKNLMIQLSDLSVFLIRKFLEIENGYRDYNIEVKNIFRDFYRKIDGRLIAKALFKEEGRYSESYNAFIGTIASKPSARWRTREY